MMGKVVFGETEITTSHLMLQQLLRQLQFMCRIMLLGWLIFKLEINDESTFNMLTKVCQMAQTEGEFLTVVFIWGMAGKYEHS